MTHTIDLHVHTHLSLCAARDAYAADYVLKAPSLGINTIGFADHTWDEKIPTTSGFYVPQTFERLMKVRDEYLALSNEDVRILFGCETEYDFGNRGVGLTAESASKLDFLLVPNSHTHITMPKDLYEDRGKHAAFMLTAWDDIMSSEVAPFITAIPHPFYAVCCPYSNREAMAKITCKQYEDAFCAAKEKNIAIEVNTSTFARMSYADIIRDEETIRMYSIAKECGCKFTFGSDAHSVDEERDFGVASVMSDVLGIKEEDILKI